MEKAQKKIMSWYNSMNPFGYNLELVIKKYLCILHDSFPGIDYSSNYQLLSGIGKYNSSYNHISFF